MGEERKVSIASRYILRAMKMSPRISRLISGLVPGAGLGPSTMLLACACRPEAPRIIASEIARDVCCMRDHPFALFKHTYQTPEEALLLLLLGRLRSGSTLGRRIGGFLTGGPAGHCRRTSAIRAARRFRHHRGGRNGRRGVPAGDVRHHSSAAMNRTALQRLGTGDEDFPPRCRTGACSGHAG